MAAGVPYIDPTVEHVGVSRLRTLNATNLRKFDKTLVIQDNNTPLAVLLTYDQFLTMQTQLQTVLETLEVITSQGEASALLDGLAALQAGKSRPLSAIRAELRGKTKQAR